MSRLFLVAVVYSVFALIVVSIASIARIFALSRDNVLPASALLGRVNPRSRTPVPAIVLSTVLIVAVMVFAALRGDAFTILIASSPVLVFMKASSSCWPTGGAATGSEGYAGTVLGRWATPVFALSTIWLVAVLVDLTVPADFRPAAVCATVTGPSRSRGTCCSSVGG